MYLFCHKKYDWVINKTLPGTKNIFVVRSWINGSGKQIQEQKRIM